MSDPLTDDANAIVNAITRRFAQHAAERIEVDEAQQARQAADLARTTAVVLDLEARVAKLEGTPAPPPATGTRIGNGLLLNAQGNSFGTFTDAQLKPFGGCISGSDKSAAFGRLHATFPTFHGFIYHTVFEIGLNQASNVWPNAMTQAEAAAKGYIYKDQAGSLLKDSHGYSYICDPSIPGYQDEWATNTKAQIAAGATGVFIDNFAPLAWWGVRPYRNGAPVTDAQIADGLAAFAVRLKREGFYVLANIGAWDQLHADFAARMCAVVDGVMIEGYTANQLQQQTVQKIQAAGRDAWVITPVGVTGGSALARQYAQAFASVWDRKGGGFSVDAAEPANANWTSVIV
jgi:hypothetical protein